MTIAISGSLSFADKFQTLATELEALGFKTTLPPSALRILNGEMTVAEIDTKKQDGSMVQYTIGMDGIRRYYQEIVKSDALLVANYEKKGTPGYIGGNTFLEMGFAHVLNKPLYVLNPLPDLPYKDELLAMQPTILHGDLTLIQQSVEVKHEQR